MGVKVTNLCPTQRATRSGIKVIENNIKVVDNYMPSNHEASRVLDTNGISATVKENHNTVNGVVEKPIYKDGVAYFPNTTLEELENDTRSVDDSDCNYRIRKLTPKECWRLMGFSDKAYDKAKNAGISNTQLYKQAGNSIVTSVLYHIYKELYSAMPYLFDDLKVSSYFSGIGAFETALDMLYDNENAENFYTPSVNFQTSQT